MEAATQEKSPIQRQAESEGLDGQLGGISMSPPAFQLRASDDGMPSGGDGSSAPVQLAKANGSIQAMAKDSGGVIQAKKATINGKKSDGPYGWSYGYDINSNKLGYFLTINVKINADSGVTKKEIGKVKRDTSQAFKKIWNKKFKLTDTATKKSKTLHCNVNFVDKGEHLAVTLKKGSGRDNLSNWYTVGDSTTRAHELGHQLGLKDEYIDASVPNRATGTSPGVHTDNSIMGNYYNEGIGKAEAKERHGDEMAGDIGSALGSKLDASMK